MGYLITITSENDIYYLLSKIKKILEVFCPTDMDRQKVMVSASELAHNVLDHAGGKGYIRCIQLKDGIRIEAIDQGPGIFNLDEALNGKSSFSTRGLGKGLAGVFRLMDDVHIESSTEGTNIIATKWLCCRGRNDST